MNSLILSSYTKEDFTSFLNEAVKNEISKLEIFKSPPETEYLSRKKTAELLGISLPTLNLWTKNGIIKGYRIASRVRYKKSEVCESLESIKTRRA